MHDRFSSYSEKNFVLQVTEIDFRHYQNHFASIVAQQDLKKPWIPACL